jgi:hypothetical protein
MAPPVEDKGANLMLPETLQAPHLRHLVLSNFALLIGSQLLTTARYPRSSHELIHLLSATGRKKSIGAEHLANVLFQWISSMPQLETLTVCSVFTSLFPNPDRDERHCLSHMPIMTSSNLRHVRFKGPSAYLEAVVG